MARRIGKLAAGAAFVLVLIAEPSQAQQTPPPTIADFVEPARMGSASLSPSGRYLVWVARVGDDSQVRVRDLETDAVTVMNAGSAREQFGGVYVGWIAWKGDDRLLIGLTRLEVGRTGGREDGRIHTVKFGQSVLSVARDGSGMMELRAPRAEDGVPGDVLDTLADDPDHILMTYRDIGDNLDVARVDVRTGASERILDGAVRVLDYVTDRSGAIVGRMIYRSGGRVVMLEARNADGGWTEVYRLRQDEIRDLPDYEFLGATADPGKVYVAVQPEAAGAGAGGDTSAVHVFDFATRSMGPAIWSHDRYDVSGIVVNADTREMAAACYWADIYRCDFTDRRDNAVMEGIRRFLGAGWSISVVSQARDGSRWLVQASSPTRPADYYIFHVSERRMQFLGSAFPQLPEHGSGETQRIDYTATDGQALFGYLTRPLGLAPDAKPPLVVMPHGGPEIRDYLTYDRWVQFLASRGYQVFQPNFRGSGGLGRSFAEAGYRQWGRRMQDDVTDGVSHLVDQGLAEAGRACILGASYGGYAALQSGASQPELYRCVVAVSGPSDLPSMMRWERGEAGADSDRYDYWVKSIGDPRTDRAAMEAVSPLRAAETWRLPLLLIHGERDDVVPVSQSRDMERALRRARKPVKLVVLNGAGHSDWSSHDETEALTEIEAFLAQHLPATPPQAPPQT